MATWHSPNPTLSEFFEREVLPRLTVEQVFTWPGHRFKPAGADKLQGYCPRHDSKSGTSFTVTPSLMKWFCPGCDNAGGTPIQYRHWLQTGTLEVRGADYVERVRELAAAVGLDLPEREQTEAERQKAAAREIRRAILGVVIQETEAALWTEDAAPVREYLASRGFTNTDLRELHIGLYPDLAKIEAALRAAGMDLNFAQQMGVLNPQWVGFTVWPWLDAYGQPLTLYAKWQEKTPPQMRHHAGWRYRRNKMLVEWNNLPEPEKAARPWQEPQVTKTMALPGDGTKAVPMYLDRARRAGVKDLVVVEGVTDAALAQVRGDARVVAPVAAHISALQIETMQRCGIRSVAICLDPDPVGRKNTGSNLLRLEHAGIAGYVVPCLPDGLDPDEFIQRHGIEAWKAHVAQAIHAYRFHAEAIIARHKGSGDWTDATRKRALDEALQFYNTRRERAGAELGSFFLPVIQEQAGIDLRTGERIGGDDPAALLAAAREADADQRPMLLKELARRVAGNAVAVDLWAERARGACGITKNAFLTLVRDAQREAKEARKEAEREARRLRLEERRANGAGRGGEQPDGAVNFDDFRAYMPEHEYIFLPTGELWPAASVNSRLPEVDTGRVDGEGTPIFESPAAWLDKNQPVEQMTWAPGEPQLIEGRLVKDGGWIERPGCTVFNLYRPPVILPGDPDSVLPWWNHLVRIYGEEGAARIVTWLAHRVQFPGEKLNHALVLGGSQGIGKDTLLEPVKAAVGPWNFQEVSPTQVTGRFNGFVKSVILRVSEARDLGEVDRYSFYEKMKQFIAAPPDVLRCDEKNRHEYYVPNVCGVIFTTNNRLNGLYLPEDDRRHYVVWSELTKDDFAPDYWQNLWAWYKAGGTANIAAYLRTFDLSGFDAKAPPEKTDAWWTMVGTDRAPEDDELTDALEMLGKPMVLTIDRLLSLDLVSLDFKDWLRDRSKARSVLHRFERAGYAVVRNPERPSDGRWTLELPGGPTRRITIYAKKNAPEKDRLAAAWHYVRGGA